MLTSRATTLNTSRLVRVSQSESVSPDRLAAGGGGASKSVSHGPSGGGSAVRAGKPAPASGRRRPSESFSPSWGTASLSRLVRVSTDSAAAGPSKSESPGDGPGASSESVYPSGPRQPAVRVECGCRPDQFYKIGWSQQPSARRFLQHWVSQTISAIKSLFLYGLKRNDFQVRICSDAIASALTHVLERQDTQQQQQLEFQKQQQEEIAVIKEQQQKQLEFQKQQQEFQKQQQEEIAVIKGLLARTRGGSCCASDIEVSDYESICQILKLFFQFTTGSPTAEELLAKQKVEFWFVLLFKLLWMNPEFVRFQGREG